MNPTEQTHTPTPWIGERFGCIRGGDVIEYVGGKGQPQIVMVSGGDYQQGNTELIVRAVNSHAAFFKACSDQVQYYEEVLKKRRLSFAEQALLDGHKAAIEHASGPGID